MTDKNQPLVSVVIPCYNHENFVQDCIQSVINQTYQNIELIIIDDGSKDESVKKIQKLVNQCKERFIRFEFKNRSNKGLCTTLNEALEWCQGEYYSVIASDDMIEKDKIDIQVNYLNKHPEIVALYGSIKSINHENKLRKIFKVRNELVDFKKILTGNYTLYAPTQITKLAAVNLVGKYSTDTKLEDLDILLKLTHMGWNVMCIDNILASYRDHDENITKNRKIIFNERIKLINKYQDSEFYAQAVTTLELDRLNYYLWYDKRNALIEIQKLKKDHSITTLQTFVFFVKLIIPYTYLKAVKDLFFK
ncbi:glycosyltransferase family 2 protein [Acinetobacter sp. ANC 4178]|uniref:glycosyltransferase family 2 protein n=1 Tax=Acinetobacter sp. ANC 4178 TaxID=2529839 RepID=UPI00103B0820|nr:glycosyltransferase family A protein [Acinetobacter sp. ANC 4178]TCB65062.1 glycosyltransferase family 2 protein [Acinetobacter sp. ANC 4178]